jgi:D-serine deaminase-like pyridoxal phosphate-dependent protein
MIRIPPSFDLPVSPALVILGEALERNLMAMQARCDAANVRLRAHGKMHKCSTLARRQIALGAAGVCAQTIGEAEVFAATGIADILITSPVALQSAPRVAALSARTRIGAVADDARLIAALSEAALGAGGIIDLVVDVDLGQHRSGGLPQDAGTLAQAAADAPGLKYRGVQAYLGHLQHIADLDARRAANDAASARLKVLVGELAARGLAPSVVTGGGTGTHTLDLAGGVFNELQAGSYALMDVEYDDCGAPDGAAWPFEPALLIAARVVSTVHKSHVVVDAGLKAVSVDGPPARVIAGAAKGSLWRPMGDEHGAVFHPSALGALREAGRDPLAFERAISAIDANSDRPFADDAPKLGDVVWLQPGHCDPTVNLYDAFVVWNEGGWTPWPIDARRTTPPI